MDNKSRVKSEPKYVPIASFLKGKSSQIICGVDYKDNVILGARDGKLITALISYDSYKDLSKTKALIDLETTKSLMKNE